MLKNSSVSRVEGRGFVAKFRAFNQRSSRVIVLCHSTTPIPLWLSEIRYSCFFLSQFWIFSPFFPSLFRYLRRGSFFFFLSIFQIFNEKCHPTFSVGLERFFFLNWKCFPCMRETCDKKIRTKKYIVFPFFPPLLLIKKK